MKETWPIDESVDDPTQPGDSKWRQTGALSCQNSPRHGVEEVQTKARRHYHETSTEAVDYYVS